MVLLNVGILLHLGCHLFPYNICQLLSDMYIAMLQGFLIMKLTTQFRTYDSLYGKLQ